MGLLGSGRKAGLSFDNVASPHPMQIRYLAVGLRNKSQADSGVFPSKATQAAVLYA